MTLHESADKFSLTKVEHSHPLVSKIRGGDGPSLCVFDFFFYIYFFICATKSVICYLMLYFFGVNTC